MCGIGRAPVGVVGVRAGWVLGQSTISTLVISKRAPPVSASVTVIVQLCAVAISLTIARPKPVPSVLVV
jgi:hypothetical protein